MSKPDPEASLSPKLSIEQQLELDGICADFEAQWKQHTDLPPPLMNWMDRAAASALPKSALFRELLSIDIDFRHSHSMPTSSEQLQKLYPDFSADIEHVLSLIADRDVSTTSPSLFERLAAQQSVQLKEFIKSLEDAPLSELPPSIAKWTQEQLARARNMAQTQVHLSQQWTPSIRPSGNQMEQLGDFRIIREIGRGGMGTVFEAEQLSLRRRVALKVLWLGDRQNAEWVQRFEREATTIANLHHTNIVPIFAVGEQEGINYYAMQMIDGQSLDGLMKLKSEETGNHQNVVDWAVQAADALAHAHERGVIHRDIKPSNLMLDSSGRLWLTDFGLAKREQDQSLSLAGVMLGTPRYMSPEQASSNLQSVDHRSDIYSLGATLYELLAGRPVFDGNSPFVLIKQILSDEPTAVDRICHQVPRDLATIVMKCLRKAPRERYASAKDLLADLRCVQEGRTIQARRASLLDAAGKWIKRHQQSMRTSILAAALLLMISGASLLTWMTVSQYFTTQLKLKNGTRPATVEFYNAQRQISRPSLALPTTEPLILRSEPLTLRFQGKGYPSIDYRWLAKPQTMDEFQVELQQQDWTYPRQARLDYQIIGAEPKRQIVSWTDRKLFMDIPGTLHAAPQIQQPSDGIELKKLSDQTDVRWLASLGSDLDGDGVDEVLVAFSRQSAVHLVSRKSGRLWVQNFAEDQDKRTKNDLPILAKENRGEVLQLPELVPDQDGDGKRDLLMTIGQNPDDPPSDASKAIRSVVLVSASGKMLWRHDIDSAKFQLPPGALVARTLQWQLTDPISLGTKNLSNTLTRNGRRLRHMDRELISEAPHLEAPQAKWLLHSGHNQVLIRTGTQLQLLDLANGKVLEPAQETSIVSAVPLIFRDFNNDGATEVMMIESLAPLQNPVSGSLMNQIPQTRMVVWSIQKQGILWETKVDSKPPAYSARPIDEESRAGTGHRWPVVMNDTLHGTTTLVVPWSIPRNVGYTGLSLPSSELAMVEASTGKAMWTCRVPNIDCWTDQIAILPDVDQDGTPEVAIASLWGEPFEWVVECRSGRNGELIWMQHQKISPDQFDEIGSLLYLPDSGRLQLSLKNVENNLIAFHLDPDSGDVVQSLSDFQKLDFLDFDGDKVEDWCITQSEWGEGSPRKTLQIVKGNFRDRWRRLGLQVEPGSDFDMDGVVDLLSIKDDGVLAFSSRTGEILWQYQPSTEWAECRGSTWESEQNAIASSGQHFDSKGFAERETWDVDLDGTLDIVLQTVTIQGRESSPSIMVLSGKNGKPLWQSRANTDHHEAMPPLTICDLDGDRSLDILAIEWLNQIPKEKIGNGTSAQKPLSRRVSLTRWELGNPESIWTSPIESPGGMSVINRWNQEADMTDFPRPVLLEIDRDGVADLALVMDSQSPDEAPNLVIGGISGRNGSLAWTKPLGIVQYDSQTIARSKRFATADVDSDGCAELVELKFVQQKNENKVSEIVAQLQAWDGATGNLKWLFKHPMDGDFRFNRSYQFVKPIAGRGAEKQTWIAIPVRTDNKDVLLVVNGQGQLLGSSELEFESSEKRPVPCWTIDLDGDEQDELLFDDGNGLVSFDVNDTLQLKQRFPIRAGGSDDEVLLVEVNDQQHHLVVIHQFDYSATGFNLSDGQPIWRVEGLQSQKQIRSGRQPAQIVNKVWSGESVPGYEAPWLVFNGYHDETSLQTAFRLTGQPFPKTTIEGIPLKAVSKPDDFRTQRPLPWADPSSPYAIFNKTSLFVTMIGTVLLASGVLIWSPWAVWKCLRKGWISHLGALLLGFLIVALNVLFLGQTFTIPFLMERPDWHDKLGVAVSYAPLWTVLYVVPQWIWRGAWRRGLVWLLLTLALSVAMGVLALYEDQTQAPMAQGESYAISWSLAPLAIGLFAASWLATLVWIAGKIFRALIRLLERCLGRSPRIVELLKSQLPNSQTVEVPVKTNRRPRYVRTLYLWGIAAIGLWVMLCPDWKGVSYVPQETSIRTALGDWDFSYGAFPNGSFELDQNSGFFLWEKPASTGSLPSIIRWPWQSVTNMHHIEFDRVKMLVRFMGSLAIWGGLLFLAGSISANERRDSGWFWVGLMTLLWTIILVVCMVLKVMTMGYFPLEFWTELMFCAGWFIGYVVVWWSTARKKNSLAKTAYSPSSQKPKQISNEEPAKADRKVRYILDLWWLVFGFALAFGTGLWLINVLPEVIDPDWKPAMGPYLGGPRPSTMRLIGWICFGLALLSGAVFSLRRTFHGFGIGLFIGWLLWSIFNWFA